MLIVLRFIQTQIMLRQAQVIGVFDCGKLTNIPDGALSQKIGSYVNNRYVSLFFII